MRQLAPSSRLSLSQICKRFRTTTNTFIGDLFPASVPGSAVAYPPHRPESGCYTINGEPFIADVCKTPGDPLESAEAEERFAFLCMLERDGTMSKSKLSCSGCSQAHHRSLFTPPAVAQDSSKRKCIGQEGRLWICPHRIWSCAWMNAIRTQPSFHRYYQYACPCPVDVDIFSITLGLKVTYPLCEVKFGEKFSVRDIVAACKAAEIQFCPHLRSRDEAILNCLHADCDRLTTLSCLLIFSPGCPNEEAHSGLQCRMCMTTVSFGIHKTAADTQKLKANVKRHYAQPTNLQTMFRPTDPEWIKHLAMPAEFASLKENYEIHTLKNLVSPTVPKPYVTYPV